MCSQCNRARGFGQPGFEPGEAVARLNSEIAARVSAPDPLRCCDDPGWNWRQYVAERHGPGK